MRDHRRVFKWGSHLVQLLFNRNFSGVLRIDEGAEQGSQARGTILSIIVKTEATRGPSGVNDQTGSACSCHGILCSHEKGETADTQQPGAPPGMKRERSEPERGTGVVTVRYFAILTNMQ